MGYLEVTDQPFPDDIDGIFLGTPPQDPAAVIVDIGNRRYEWPWREALSFAVELARMAGMASVRDPDPVEEDQ